MSTLWFKVRASQSGLSPAIIVYNHNPTGVLHRIADIIREGRKHEIGTVLRDFPEESAVVDALRNLISCYTVISVGEEFYDRVKGRYFVITVK